MKTILTLAAALTLFASAANANTNAFPADFWEQQAQESGNTVDLDGIRTGQIVHPKGIFGAE